MAPEPPVVCECEECGRKIYEGYQYYHIGEHNFCESCVDSGYTDAELEDGYVKLLFPF